MTQYEQNVALFKALSDVNRLEIVDMLSCGELCACKILEHFKITQPTLSHHMKILCDCGLVSSCKHGKWTYYSINKNTANSFKEFLHSLTTEKSDCLCRRAVCDCERA
ncbi:MAG: metalloregulator ArsR/SmtB family transcription factor [Oscillospiraceae bacterium]|nr:metalloregulator ArsR/SmtB family transcription factor [Oscillospiraceae bacterium]